MFQGLRQGSILYILEKSDRPTLKEGQVTEVGKQQTKYGQYIPGQAYGQNVETTVDVVVKVGDETINLEKLPALLSITDHKGVVVSESRDAMINEVAGMLRASTQVIESVPYHQGVIERCEEMMLRLNPSLKKEKEQEQKISSLEQEIYGMKGTLSEMKDLLVKVNKKMT